MKQGGGSDSLDYTYYADGLRATKKENGDKTRYVYVNGVVVEELDGSNRVKAQNIWGNELLFRKDVGSNQEGYYSLNSHGDVVAITDSDGKILNQYEYDSWGNVTSRVEGMNNPFLYSGEMYDEKAGLYYLRARYYDPSVGRFISEDTNKGQVDNPLTLNRYTYVHNNPTRYFDPTGNQAVEYGSVGGGGGGVALPINSKEAFNIITFGILMGAAAAPKEVPQVTESKPQLTVIQGGKSENTSPSNTNRPNPIPVPDQNDDNNKKLILYHYTDAKGYLGILKSGVINPSLQAIRPQDARLGDGVYFTDIAPNSMPPKELSQILYNNPGQQNRAEYYFAIDVSKLLIKDGTEIKREHIFAYLTDKPLPIRDKTVGFGKTYP